MLCVCVSEVFVRAAAVPFDSDVHHLSVPTGVHSGGEGGRLQDTSHQALRHPCQVHTLTHYSLLLISP